MKIPETFLPERSLDEKLEELKEPRPFAKGSEDVEGIISQLQRTDHHPSVRIQGENVNYVCQDWHDDSAFVAEIRCEHISFSKNDLQRLAGEALASAKKRASLGFKGEYFMYHEKWDDWAGHHEGPYKEHRCVAILATLKVSESGEPNLTLSFNKS